jgi:hypothetical protein
MVMATITVMVMRRNSGACFRGLHMRCWHLAYQAVCVV